MRPIPFKNIARAAFWLLWAAPALRAAGYSEAEITRIHEEVKVLKANATPRTARTGERILPVTSVATGANSRAELRFPDRSLTRLGANSRFTLRGEGRTLDLTEGVMMLQVPKKQGGAKVRAAGVTAAVTGTTVLVECHPGGVIKLIVIEGTCILSLNGQPGVVQEAGAGQMIVMQDGDTSIPLPVDVDLAKLLQTSKLLSADDSTQPNQQEIAQAVQIQQQLLKDGDLVKANFFVPGTGLTISLNNNTRNNLGNLQLFQQQSQIVNIVQQVNNPPPPKNTAPPPPAPPPPPPPPPSSGGGGGGPSTGL